MTGKISIVGIGPGSLPNITPAAQQAIEQAQIILGYTTYLHQIETLAITTPRLSSGMKQEVARAHKAIELASQGQHVALISGGDAGIYGMAGLVYEILHQQVEEPPDIEVIPGVSALNAAASVLGAPLMTDFVVISLSDQMVPRQQIIYRLELVAQADMVICLYNPRGRQRSEPLEIACAILQQYRSPQTPVGIVRHAHRPEQSVTIVPLSQLLQVDIDMNCIVIVGNSQTFIYRDRMVTPRGYADRYDLKKDCDDASKRD